MKEKTKLIYTALYISFLIAMFVLFGVVQNHAPGMISFYVVIFLILTIVSVLFYFSTQKKEFQIVTVASNSEDPSFNDDPADDPVEENIEKEIDIQKIVPAKNTDINKYSEELLQNLSKSFPIVQALFYIKNPNEDLFHCYAEYAYFSENEPSEFRTGESLPGQAVKNKTIVSLDNIPDNYMVVASGLGNSDPKYLVFVPVKNNHDEVVGLIEYASFEPLTQNHTKALEGISVKVAETISKHLKSK